MKVWQRSSIERITDLSAFMQTFNWRVSWEGNQRNGTSGHPPRRTVGPWGGRFKSKLVEDEKALDMVVSYIELNPIRAKVYQKTEGKKKERVTEPSEYPWCTAGRLQKCH